ncbi:DUF5668 domain-containing protein [Bacillus sp. B15-48]|uniref:LiaI-LiaF-like domain-containing protein n=1 Tax=Bacillus sp. B15-48 TaxID=1548601 RepID=UPI00193FFD0C|nr:DUF5668 domain-containing protein [Bacillus sp. B15-48]MBM4762465.1 hypothetical protein [Bacillus sp. B15-48]
MKNINIIPGILLIGFGFYYYSQQVGFILFEQFHTWPTLLGIVGLAFLVHGYWGKNYESILPGVIFLGFSIHLLVVGRLQIWPDHLGAFLLIISLAFMLRYQKLGVGLVHGILFLILAAILLFYDELTAQFIGVNNATNPILNHWPILLILLGLYLLVKNKNRH